MRNAFFVFIILAIALPLSAAERAKKVLYIGIDGTRFDSIERAETPHLDALLKNGIHSPTCLILGQRYQKNDTISGPGWSSILTGVWADKHGVHDNAFVGDKYADYPHFFVRLKKQFPNAQGTVSHVTWEPIHKKITQAADVSVNYEEKAHTIEAYVKYDAAAVAASVKELSEGNPDLLVAYIGQVDVAGHAKGFHPTVPEYIAAVERTDKLVGELTAAMKARKTFADEDWLVIVVSDHGGKGKGHGKGHQSPEILNSFLIVSGAAAERGEFTEQTYLVDAPVTALVHLGVKLKDDWQLDGKPRGLKK